jgi:hypothetical protein
MKGLQRARWFALATKPDTKSVANVIALIDRDILWDIYSKYPELDDQK